MTAPAAARHPLQLERHGVRWTDDYAWLRDPGYPEVRDSRILAYLEAENARFKETMEPHRPFIDRLHAELKGRNKDDEASVPAPHGPWLYGWRFQAGAQYRSWYRRDREGGGETVILDEPALASGKDYFNLRSLAISQDHRLLAYTTDDDGSERYVVHIRNLETGGETPLQRQLAHFVAVMKRTAEPLVDALDAGRTLAAALEAERQIRQGGWNIADHSATSTREQPS